MVLSKTWVFFMESSKQKHSLYRLYAKQPNLQQQESIVYHHDCGWAANYKRFRVCHYDRSKNGLGRLDCFEVNTPNATISLQKIVFPWAITFLPAFILISNTLSINEPYYLSLAVEPLIPLFMVSVSLVFFYQWRGLIVSREKNNPFQGLSFCNKRHIPFFLTFVLISSAVFSYGYRCQDFNLALFALFVESALLVWITILSPYESVFHNVGLLVNMLLAILFLFFDVFRKYYPALKTEKNEIYLALTMVGTASISSLMSIGRLIFEIYLAKKIEEGYTQKKMQRKEANMKKKEQLLNKLERMRDQCEKTPNQQIDLAYLQKFRKENGYTSPQKLKEQAISRITDGNEKSRKNEMLLKKKLRNKFGQINSIYNKRKNLDSLD